MTKRKKLAKNALKHPERFSYGELAYFQKWLEEHKQVKAAKKAACKAEEEAKEIEAADSNTDSQT